MIDHEHARELRAIEISGGEVMRFGSSDGGKTVPIGSSDGGKTVPIGSVVRVIAAFVAAFLFVSAGLDARNIQSVSGNSIAEAFYQAFGYFCFGMAAMTVMLGSPSS
jgi:hypothetical protein